ncbi:MAG: hypothetical protein KGM91_23190 [Burkholderiales bacterium]|nr:hypothetical protein [Burkholderiales bacterium]
MTTPKRAPGKPWPKGTSGNPRGKLPGTKSRQTLIAQYLLDVDAASVVQVIVAAAKSGDLGACRALLGHILTPVRERALPAIYLPAADDAQGVQQALGALIAAVAEGRLLPGEAQAVAGLLTAKLKIIEAVEIESRLTALEKKA